jgi:lipooligosaccharide transport system permease protein
MATPLAFRVAEGEARVYRRIWRGSVFTSFLSPVLYLIAMGVGLGSLIDANLPEGVEGMSYLTFLAPGLLVATAMQTGAGEGAWKVMAGFKWRKTYFATLATPVGVRGLVFGLLLWGAARLMIVSVAFAIVIIAFRIIDPIPALLAVIPALLVGMATLAPVMAYTAALKREQGLTTLFRFGIVPMFLFSGTFFPISQLPDWLQPIAFVTPLFHGVELARWITLDIDPAVLPWVGVAYLLAWFAAGSWVAVVRFRTRLLV